jgi:hypothetical protein
MNRSIFIIVIIAATSALIAQGESPLTVVVPAMTPSASTSSTGNTSAAAGQKPEVLPDEIKSLQEMKAANDEMLKKQEAMLQQLDDIQKAADQLRIFSKRG